MPKRKSARRRPGRPKQSSGIWQRGKWWFVGSGIIGGVAVLVVLTFALSGPQARESELGVSNPAPDVALATLNGDFKISEQRGDALLLYFSFPG